MTKANVQSISKDFIAVRVSMSDNSSQVKNTSGDSFGKHLDRTSKEGFKAEGKQTETSKKSDLNDEIRKNQNISKKQKELEEQAVCDTKAAETVTASVNSNAADVTKELKEAIAEELDMSVKELEGLMGTMNFDDAALFDAEKLGMIVLTANELTQTQDLLFDSEAAAQFKNAMELLDNAVVKLEQSGVRVSEEGFSDIVTGETIQPDNVNADTPKPKADTGMEAEQNVQKDILSAADDGDDNVKNVVVTTADNDNAPKDNEPVADEKVLSQENLKTDIKPQENEDTKQNTGNDGKNHREHNAKADDGVITDANVRFNPLEEIQVELADRVGRSQAENIVNQIMEQIKFNVNEEFKSMELQLYPENLGKVGVQVAVKDGILTAQITAENETVKRAIEAQLINLRESFNNQGLKVENVEVTIASHSFEENNMHNQDGQSNQGRGRRSRRLNSALVNEFGGISDEQSEDAVMEALGNTVSYTA